MRAQLVELWIRATVYLWKFKMTSGAASSEYLVYVCDRLKDLVKSQEEFEEYCAKGLCDAFKAFYDSLFDQGKSLM